MRHIAFVMADRPMTSSVCGLSFTLSPRLGYLAA
jgi:hypothetical protein